MSSAERSGGAASGNAELIDVFVKLLNAEPGRCDRDGLDRIVARSLRLRGWLEALDARVAARADDLAAKGRSEAASSLLARGGRRGRRDAQAAAKRGDVCTRMPAFGSALAGGKVSAGHVDAVSNATRGLDDDAKARFAEHADDLVKDAETMAPEQFERHCRDRARRVSRDDGVGRHEKVRAQRNVRRWVDRDSGTCKTLLTLDPLADAQIWTAIHAAVAAARKHQPADDDRTWDQLQADVVVDLLCGGAGSGERPVPEVSVLIDLDTLLRGLHDSSLCETSDGTDLPVSTIRRLCCDAHIIPVVLGGDGEVLDVGRERRLATRAQRRALRAMYRTCAYPGCTVDFDQCRIHHVKPWELGGRTDLADLAPVCELHHHLVHEGGWTLTLHPDRRAEWRRPDGTLWQESDSKNRRRAAESTKPRDPEIEALRATIEQTLLTITSRPPP